MMKYKNYIGRVEFDAQAGILHGQVVGIRDVVTFQGKSVEEIEQAFRDSVDDYLAFCKERGEHPNRPSSGNFALRLDPELHRKANMLAGASGKSLNAWVAECLNRAVEQEFPTLGRAKSNRTGRRGKKAASGKTVKA
jgi:predicted HicB family RNase H-like nuclease